MACPSFGEGPLVSDQLARLNNLADDWGSQAERRIAGVSALVREVETRTINTTFPIDLPAGGLAGFTMPADPAEPDLGYTAPAVPATPAIPAVTAPAFGERPTFAATAPTIDLSGMPGALAASHVGAVPEVMPAELPDFETQPLPSVTLPAVPQIGDLVLPSLAVTVPTANFGALHPVFDFHDPGYADAQVDLLKTKISGALNGEGGLPASFWDAVFSRGAGMLARVAATATRQATSEHARRGWEFPGGKLLADLERVQSETGEQTAALAHERMKLWTESARDDFWKAVQAGSALQNMLIGFYAAFQERALRAASAEVEATVAVYNANVAAFNAQVQTTQARIQAAELQLRGALAQIDQEKLRIESARLAGDLQQVRVQTYLAQMEGVKAAVGQFEARVRAAALHIESEKLRIETHGLTLKSREVEVGAWAKEWDGWVAKQQGQKVGVDLYGQEAQVFGELMKGYATDIDAGKVRVDAQVATAKNQVEVATLAVQRYRDEWAAINQRLDALSRVYASRAGLFSAKVQAESTRVAAEDRQVSIGIEQARLRQGAEVESARLAVEQIARISNVQMTGLDGMMKTIAQLTSAVYAAANISVQSSFGTNESVGCNTTYSYSM